MDRPGRRLLSGRLAAVGILAACASGLMTAPVSQAAVPAAGINCVASDGKIDGLGATYQNKAHKNVFIPGFNADVCGNTPSSPADESNSNMVVYNSNNAQSFNGGYTGSGKGKQAANCRTDAFAGSDVPYFENELGSNGGPSFSTTTGLDGTPGNSTVGCPAYSVGSPATFFSEPFAPNTTSNGAGTYPAAGDQASLMMSFPVAGSSVGIPVKLTAADCGGTAPSNLQFTGTQMAAIWSGSVLNWNDSSLTSNNPSLAGCNIPIVRVVRKDDSGTTSIFKRYLQNIDTTRSGQACNAAFGTWGSSTSNGAHNTAWPGSGTAWTTQPAGTLGGQQASGTCSGWVTGAASGGGALLTSLGGVEGGVGYADLADVVTTTVTGLLTAKVQNATATSYTSPGSGLAANCNFGAALSLPGSTPADAVGLNPQDNWGFDNNVVNQPNGAVSHIDATDAGSQYPICGITFDFVYSNVGLGAGASPNPIAALSSDQRRTLYSYFTYVLSANAQSQLTGQYYQSLPPAWLPTLLKGFQQNF